MTVQDLCVALWHIPQHEFDERAVQNLAQALSRRIGDSNFSHTEEGSDVAERLEDIATICGNKADAIAEESYREAA